jgi:hypothetical protein
MFVDPSGHQRAAGYYTINGSYGWYADPDASEFGKNSDTYKTIDDLSKKWFATSDQAERDRLHGIANGARDAFRNSTPFKYGNDVVMDLLNTNLQTGKKAEANIMYLNFFTMILGPDAFHKVVKVELLTWLTQEHFAIPGNPRWDYKWDPNWQVPYSEMWVQGNDGLWFSTNMNHSSNPKNWTPWIYFGGELMAADHLANLNWGYVGTGLGFGGWQLLNGLTDHGGGDKDAYFIRMGIQLANSR